MKETICTVAGLIGGFLLPFWRLGFGDYHAACVYGSGFLTELQTAAVGKSSIPRAESSSTADGRLWQRNSAHCC